MQLPYNSQTNNILYNDFIPKPIEKLTNSPTMTESSVDFESDLNSNQKDNPKEVGASIFVVGDDSLSPLLADDDEPLVSPLPPGSAGLGSVEAVNISNNKDLNEF